MPDGTIIQNIPDDVLKAEKPAAGGAESTPKTPAGQTSPTAPTGAPPSRWQDFMNLSKQVLDVPPPLAAMRAVGGAGSILDTLGKKAGGAIAESGPMTFGDPETGQRTEINLPPWLKGGVATAADIGVGTIPGMAFGGGVGGAAGQPLMRGAARKGMQWAIRPENVLESDAARAIDTMLEKGLNVSKKGFKELQRQVDELGKEISGTIGYSTKKVDLPDIYKNLKTAFKKAEAFTDAKKRFEVIEDAWKEFVNSPLLGGQKRIPVQTALRSKRAISEQLKPSDYSIPIQGKEAEAQARSDALKAIQEGERGELLKKEPGIAKPMAEQEKLLNAMDQIERRVIMEARKNPGGLTMFAISHPKEFAAFMVDRTSAFKSAIANMLFRNQRSLPAGLGAGGVGASQMIQAPPLTLPTFSMHQPQQQP